MKQEEIAKQAEKYAVSKLIDTSSHSLHERRKLLDYDNYDLSQSFADGAEWMINSVWHDASEFPSRYSSVLISSGVRRPYIMKPINREHWAKYIEHNCVKRWAYLSDLLPQEKGEEQ